MQELTWEKLLISQQQDFIARFKYDVQNSLASGYDGIERQYLLSKFRFYDENYKNYDAFLFEIIQIDLYFDDVYDHPEEDDPLFLGQYIDRFCMEMSYKYYQINEDYWEYKYRQCFETFYQADQYMNHYIGKLGEEVVKLYLGGLITEVDYNLYQYGDGGVDFRLTKDKNIGIQVKTHALFRIDTQTKVDHNLDGGDIFSIFFQNISTSIAEVKWQVTPDELNKNKVCIFVLLLSFVEGEGTSPQPELLMAGWKPSHMINNINCIQMEDLFYMGGIRIYLESL
ncbi:putative tPR repeat protein [Lyngbya aestuarii BL J]|uniref:Putative tPR repeat protein n=1 Tax=Lyngbya aestuarii BL J TaxID=1348334 RepID=U7QQ42_9CYAN|nr:hypothetical protein [Lyngbya aestuarii]ERT08531.1 putative tPR repeat protein [Lyngbya aestuarii BL J]